MLTHDEAVPEALDGDIAQDLVVVLVAGSMEPHRLAGIGLEGFLQYGISHLLVQAELGILHDEPGHVFKERCRCGWIHPGRIQMHTNLHILHGKDGSGEPPVAAVPFRSGQNRPRPFQRIRNLWGIPGGMKAGIGQTHRPEPCGFEVLGHTLQRTYLIGIEELAGHFSLELDIGIPRREDELRTHQGTVGGIFLCRRRKEISVLRIREKQLSPSPGVQIVYCFLDGLSIIRNSVTLGAEHHNVQLPRAGSFLNASLGRNARDKGGKTQNYDKKPSHLITTFLQSSVTMSGRASGSRKWKRTLER